MDRNFKRALSLVLKHEGGWADHPKDPGGATMKGVTIGTFRAYVKPSATKDDLRKITDEQIATVYRRHYWDKIAGAELPDGVDYAVFDFAVNSGPDRAAKYLQAVLGVPQDGKIGPATIKAARDKLPPGTINQLCDKRMAFLRGLKTWGTFRKGWTARVKSVRSEALELSSKPSPERPSVIVKEVEVTVDKPVVPQQVETEVKEKSDRWSWLTGLFGSGALGLSWLSGMDWQAVLAGGGVLIVMLIIILVLRSQIVAAVKDVREAVEN